MKNKDIYIKILELTADENWTSCPDTIKKVQSLSKHISGERRPPTDFTSIAGIEVTYSDGSKKTYKSLDSCSEGEKLLPGTIRKCINRKIKRIDGRYFQLM